MGKKLNLPREGEIVIVTDKIESLRGAPDPPIGTCVSNGAVGKCGVIFENGEMWWGSVSLVFPYADHAASSSASGSPTTTDGPSKKKMEPPTGLEPAQS